MVSTRNHPKSFPEPTPSLSGSPTKSTRSSLTPAPTSSPSKAVSRATESVSRASEQVKDVASTNISTPKKHSHQTSAWSHTPSNTTLLWLAVSLPLVVWDSIYVFGRPHTMTGGKFVWPFYTPYELYGTIDHIYGFKAWNANNGFTAAQGTLNVLETAMYLYYLYIVFTHGRQEEVQGRGAPAKKNLGALGFLGESRTVYGRQAAIAVLIAYASALMTLSKTVLYWLNEAWSGFDNIGHNDPITLFFMWIIPNGAWIVLPTYMLYVFGQEILEGLEIAAGETKKTR